MCEGTHVTPVTIMKIWVTHALKYTVGIMSTVTTVQCVPTILVQVTPNRVGSKNLLMSAEVLIISHITRHSFFVYYGT